MMKLLVNGAHADAPEGMTVELLVEGRAKSRRGVAVAVNGEVVPRSAWPSTRLRDGDRVEVLAAIGGG